MSRGGKYNHVYAYARVSSEEQARGTSLQDQQDVCLKEAEARGVTVSQYFVEAESAIHEKIERREKIQSLMRIAGARDLVLCDKIDRWSRDPEFTYGSIRELLSRGAHVYFPGDQCDPSTAEGDTMLGFRVLFAREEHKRIKLRTVGTRRKLRDRGYYSEGRPPMGYRRPHAVGYRGPEKNILVVVDEEAAKVRRMMELSAAGKSSVEIEKITGVERNTVQRLIRHRLYLGELQDSQGIWQKGLHPAIVDPDLFQRANEAMTARRFKGAAKRAQTTSTREWLLRDVAVCARCGSKCTSAFGAGTVDTPYQYYRCRQKCAPGGNIRVQAVDALAAPMIVSRLVELRREIVGGGVKQQAPIVIDYVSQLAKVSSRRGRIVDLFTDGEISREEMRARLARVDNDRTKIEAAQHVAVKSPLADKATRRRVLESVTAIESAWAKADGWTRRNIATALAKAFRLAVGEPPVPEWRTVEELSNLEVEL